MAIFVVFLLLLVIPNQVISSPVEEDLDEEASDSSDSSQISNPLLYKLGGLLAGLNPVMQFFAVATAAVPEVVEIGYGETVKVEIGLLSVDSGEWESMDEGNRIDATRYLSCEVVEYPGGFNDGSWYVNFDPSSVKLEPGKQMKLNAVISLTSPPSSDNPIQSGILKIRINDKWAANNLFCPKDWIRSSIDLLKQGNISGALGTFFGGAGFFIASILPPNPFGMMLSGSVTWDANEVDILVKVKPYHAVSFESLPLVNFKPNELAGIPISVKNLGNYNDTISFRINSSNNDKIEVPDPGSVTLKPGEVKDTLLGVAIMPSFLDFGTIHEIKVQAYSLGQPNITIAERTVFLQTKGVYISGYNAAVILFIVLIIIIIIGLFLHLRRRKIAEICQKPDKPWEIPKEKKFLEKLKIKDENKYNETLKMMEDEYKSSLLWYKYHKKAMMKKPTIGEKKIDASSGVFSKLFKKPEEKSDESTQEKQKRKDKKQR